jgi:hypothetical protein
MPTIVIQGLRAGIWDGQERRRVGKSIIQIPKSWSWRAATSLRLCQLQVEGSSQPKTIGGDSVPLSVPIAAESNESVFIIHSWPDRVEKGLKLEINPVQRIRRGVRCT